MDKQSNNKEQKPKSTNKIMLKGGLSNSIAKITECEESFITNNSKKNHEKQESRNSIKEEIRMFEGSQDQLASNGNQVGPWNTNRESNTQGALRKKGRQHQLQFPRMGVKIKGGSGQTIINESESSGLRTTRDNGERLNPIQQWSPDVISSQGFSSRYSKESINDIKAQNPQNNIKLSNYRMASKITLPTSGGEDITSSMQQTKTQIQSRERFDSDANHQQKDFIITNGFQANKNRLFSEQNKRITQGGEISNSNQNSQIQTNNHIKRKITTSGNDMPLGQGNQNRYIMTNRDQQKFFRNPKNHVYLKDLDTKSSKLIYPLNRTNFKAFPATSRHLGDSPSQHIFHSDHKLQNEIQSAFDAFENRETSIVYHNEDINLPDALEIDGNLDNLQQDDQATQLVSKVKLVPQQQNKKTLLHSSNRHRQLASVRPERKFKMNSTDSIESVFAQRSIEKMILKRTSLDQANQSSHINLSDQQKELQIPQKVNDKNEEAFGLTILKQFPNGSLSKEIYRQKVSNNQRFKTQINAKIYQKQNQNGSQDTTQNTVQQEQSFAAVNSFTDLQPSVSVKDGSDWTKESTQKPPYHLSLQRERKEKKKNQAAANKSLYINIKQSNLNKDSTGLLRRAQQESLQRLLQKFSDSDSVPTIRHQTLRLNELGGMDALASHVNEYQTDSLNPSQQIESQIPSIDTTQEHQSSSQRGLFSNKHISYKTIQISGCEGDDQLPSHYTSIQLDANTSTREEDMIIHQLSQNELKPTGMDTIVANSSKSLHNGGQSFRDQPQNSGQNSKRELSCENQNELQSQENSSVSKTRDGSLDMEVPGIAEVLESRRNSKLLQSVSTRILDFKQEKQISDLIKTVESKTVHLEGDLKAITGAHIDFKNDKSQDVLTFFRERDIWVKKIFNQYFRDNCFAEKYGLPKVVEDLLIAVVETLRSDQAEFTKYLQMRKQVADFQSQQMYVDLQSMSKELTAFQGKDEAYKKYRERLFDPACPNKMDDELICELENYDEMEGVEGYVVPSKFDFNDKVSNANVTLQKALDSAEKLTSTDVLALTASETSEQSVPFEYLQQLLNKKTTAVQKKTAFKVLQRYFRNIKTKDMGTTCTLDEDLLRKQMDLKARVAQLKEDNEALLTEKIKLSGEVERAVVQIGKANTELILQKNKVEDAEEQIKVERQKYLDLEKSMEAALNRKQKQIDNYQLQTKDIEIKFIEVQKQSVVLNSDVQVKKVKIVQKVEKIVTMRKDHKQVKTILKEEKKEVKCKLVEAKNILKMLKQGLISIEDIKDQSDVEDSQSSSESDDIDDSDKEILKQAETDPLIKEAVKQANIEKHQEKIKAALAVKLKKRKFKKGERGTEEEIEYGSDGKEIPRRPKKKKAKRKDAQGNDIIESSDEDDFEGTAHRKKSKSKKKKSKSKHGNNQESDSSEEEIVNGIKVPKKNKKTKQVEGIDYVYETDPVTGAQKKVMIKNSVPNSKGEVFVDDGYVSQFSYKQSEGGTIRRRKKKIRQPGEVPGDSSEETFEEFDEDQAIQERRQNRISQGLNPEAEKITITNEIKQALLNKFKGSKNSLQGNHEYNSKGELIGENNQGYIKNGVQMFGQIGSGDFNESREGGQGFNSSAINQQMPRKYSNFDKNGMRIQNSNTKESQTQISGPVIQSDLTESLFNKIDVLEKQAAQLQDLKNRSEKQDQQRRQQIYAQQQFEKKHEENKIQELIKKTIKQKFEKSESPVKRMNTSFFSSSSRGRLLKGSSRRIQNVDSQDKEGLIRGLIINTTQNSHKDTSLTPTRVGNHLNDISTFSQNSSDPNFANTLQPKTAVHFTKETLSDGSPMKVSLKTRRTVAFESFDHRKEQVNNSLMREDIVEESEVSLGND